MNIFPGELYDTSQMCLEEEYSTVQWNLSDMDTLGTKIIVQVSEMFLFQGEKKGIYHTCLTHANVRESMGKPCSCMQFIENPAFFLLQVMQESVSATSHVRICISTTSHVRRS